MAYDRYPVERRSNRPEYVQERPDYLPGQPASRTRFYRDKRNGKLFGVCAGIADYTGFDVALGIPANNAPTGLGSVICGE